MLIKIPFNKQFVITIFVDNVKLLFSFGSLIYFFVNFKIMIEII